MNDFYMWLHCNALSAARRSVSKVQRSTLSSQRNWWGNFLSARGIYRSSVAFQWWKLQSLQWGRH